MTRPLSQRELAYLNDYLEAERNRQLVKRYQAQFDPPISRWVWLWLAVAFLSPFAAALISAAGQ